VAKATRALALFITVGWLIYPLGYILGAPIGSFGITLVSDPAAASQAMDIVYNIADAINKIGFGLVIYVLSRSEE
jgi:sensory rhodopsin